MSPRDNPIARTLEAAGGGGPLDVARLLAELARDGMTGREAAARARAVLAEQPSTPEERAACERVLAAVEGFDDPEGADAAPAHPPEEPHEP